MTTGLWVAPVGEQLDLLVRWLEPIMERPGLTAIPQSELYIVLGESGAEAAPAFEPFSALVGPVRIDEGGVVADVIPVEPFLHLRDALAIAGEFAPRIVFARADSDHAQAPIEALASDSVVVSTLTRA